MGQYFLFRKAVHFIQAALRYRVYMKKNMKPKLRVQKRLLNEYRKAAVDFSRHRKSLNSME